MANQDAMDGIQKGMVYNALQGALYGQQKKEAETPLSLYEKDYAKRNADTEAQIANTEANRRIDFTPLAALVDQFTGSKLSQTIKRPDDNTDLLIARLRDKMAGYESPEQFKAKLQMQQDDRNEDRKMYDYKSENEFNKQIALEKIKAHANKQNNLMDPLKMLQYDALLSAKKTRDHKETPQGKLEALPGEQKKRFDDVVLGLKSITGLENVYQQPTNEVLGIDLNKVSIKGDNPFTFSRKQFKEAFGRMQSGGAINKDEKFEDFAPGLTDSPEMSKIKLENARKMFEQRYNNFGISKEDAEKAGLDPKDLGFIKAMEAQAPQGSQGLIFKEANAAPIIDDQDKAALEWANANPNDPRAASILQQLGGK